MPNKEVPKIPHTGEVYAQSPLPRSKRVGGDRNVEASKGYYWKEAPAPVRGCVWHRTGARRGILEDFRKRSDHVVKSSSASPLSTSLHAEQQTHSSPSYANQL